MVRIMTKIKLCGLTRYEDILAVNELVPDFIGFVFWEKSKRYVTAEQAKVLKEKLNPSVKAVGVFVDEDPKVIAEIANAGIIDIVQLHGSEDEEYISELRKLTSGEIIKAFKIRSTEDLKRAGKSSADRLLFDAGMGDGKVFDWSVLKAFDRPYFLAGGLDKETLPGALSLLDPDGVDVSSGIETNGRKDPEKMKLFVEAVRNFRKD